MGLIFSKGIDISEHQGSVDFNKLKASGIDFVLLRAGYGSANRYPEQYDARFEEYYKKAKAAGLGVGAYWYSYAENADMALAFMEYWMSQGIAWSEASQNPLCSGVVSDKLQPMVQPT